MDVIVEAVSYADFQGRVASRLKARGFRECTDAGAPICSWKVDDIRVDVMPTEGAFLGFTNRWYKGAVAAADSFDLDGTAIRMIGAPYFLATKFVAFEGRGDSDYYGSHDLEDVLTVLDGRPEVTDDLAQAADDVRTFVAGQVRQLLATEEFLNALPGHVEHGRDQIVLSRLRSIAGLAHEQTAQE